MGGADDGGGGAKIIIGGFHGILLEAIQAEVAATATRGFTWSGLVAPRLLQPPEHMRTNDTAACVGLTEMIMASSVG